MSEITFSFYFAYLIHALITSINCLFLEHKHLFNLLWLVSLDIKQNFKYFGFDLEVDDIQLHVL
jgi:hypothetical protein